MANYQYQPAPTPPPPPPASRWEAVKQNYRTRVAASNYITPAPNATYRMTADGAIVPNTEQQPAVVSNPMAGEITGQDLINEYYNRAKDMPSAKLNGIYNAAAALAQKDGYNLNELVNLRNTNISSLPGRYQKEMVAETRDIAPTQTQPQQVQMTQSNPWGVR